MTHLMLMIENSRKKMIELAATYGMTSSETVQCSQELDALLNLLMSEESKNIN
ncbi:aspartyl-phosphate phosphatase Spo0E family protein [Cytobacillus firmus]|uniref:Stage 0 sporulation regulatory protein n=1 Tax=Cytobacillus firmus DS1 TaxID=1307436 RepID=W7LHH3_CYTFI|nr:aspartyl-phosphate phosphatase Spo0E family protein [Cytobacillus firmus]EWG11544.1 stage 0 sporulation regulatory protein [Cytobacillus firmus DS1]